MSHSNKHIVIQAIWAASNLIADSPACRDELIAANAVKLIIKFLQSADITKN
jgi:hypothetical protein